MKNCLPILLLSLFLLPVICQAQELVSDSTRFSETMWSMKKKRMVLDFMNLSEAEKASFWPLYDSYTQALRYMEMESMHLQQLYQSLVPGDNDSDKTIARCARQIIQNEVMIARVRKQYFRKFSRALSPLRAGQFLQFDDTLRLILQVEMQMSSPEFARASIR